MASTAVSMEPWPVMITNSVDGEMICAALSRSSPPMRGIWRSESTRLISWRRRTCRASSPLPAVTTE